MKKIYCPHCGYSNNSKNHFCKHCGYDLSKYKSRIQRPIKSRSQITPHRYQHQHMGYYNPQIQPHRKSHHGFVIFIIIIVIALGLGVTGFGTYISNTWPFGNGPIGKLLNNNSINQDPSSNYATIKTFWNHVGNELDSSDSDGGSTSLTYLFKDGNDNYTLSGMKDWIHLVEDSNSRNDITVSSIKPYDFSTGNGEIHYKVRYDFDNHDGDYDHIQIFNWHAKVSDGKIVFMASPKTPAEDYNK